MTRKTKPAAKQIAKPKRKLALQKTTLKDLSVGGTGPKGGVGKRQPFTPVPN